MELRNALFILSVVLSSVLAQTSTPGPGYYCNQAQSITPANEATLTSTGSLTFNTTTYTYTSDNNFATQSYTVSNECNQTFFKSSSLKPNAIFWFTWTPTQNMDVIFQLTSDSVGREVHWNTRLTIFADLYSNTTLCDDDNFVANNDWVCEAKVTDMCQFYPNEPTDYFFTAGRRYWIILDSRSTVAATWFWVKLINRQIGFSETFDTTADGGTPAGWSFATNSLYNVGWYIGGFNTTAGYPLYRPASPPNFPDGFYFVQSGADTVGGVGSAGHPYQHFAAVNPYNNPGVNNNCSNQWSNCDHSKDLLISPLINLVAYQSASLTFSAFFFDESGTGKSASIFGYVEVSTNGATWSLLQNMVNSDSSGGQNWDTYRMSLNAYVGQSIYIRWNYKNTLTPPGYGFAVDSVFVTVHAGFVDQCEDGYTCTMHTCSTTSGNYGCIRSNNNTVCNLLSKSCVNNYCDVTTAGFDTTSGCHFIPNNTYCDDSRSCTDDTCSNTAPSSDGCVHTPFSSRCSDAYSCSDNICFTVADPDSRNVAANLQPATGCYFDFVDSHCNDSRACTVDTCSPSNPAPTGCKNTPQANLCTSQWSCVDTYCFNQTDPDPRNTAAKLETGANSGCYFDFNDLNCDDSIGCTVNHCKRTNPAGTGCNFVENNTRCDDNLPCSNDLCFGIGNTNTYYNLADPSTGCAHISTCNDNRNCTVDTCSSANVGPNSLDGCAYTPNDNLCNALSGCTANYCFNQSSSDPRAVNADSSGCVYIPDCDDGVDCTIDNCVNSTTGLDRCLHTVDLTSCDDGIDCTYELLCDVEAIGFDPVKGCVRIPMDEWCNDGNPCTVDYCNPALNQTNSCVNELIDCDDDLACTYDHCVMGVCVHTPVDSLCDDNITCTQDFCDASLGKCNNFPRDDWCDAANPDLCTENFCRPSLATNHTSGCVAQPKDCSDEIYCSVDHCDPATGTCSWVANNTLCDDGHQCTDDVCNLSLGKCTNIANSTNCDDGDACTIDFCDCTTANCTTVPVDCSDSIFCTDDACAGGNCSHTPNNTHCDDHIACTSDICSATIGRCTNFPNDTYCGDQSIFPNTLCMVWQCRPADVQDGVGCYGIPKDCDDGLACTHDSCDNATGRCINTPDNNLCEDMRTCTDDICDTMLGRCTNYGNASKCDDHNNCTIDICKTDGECFNQPKFCDDEIACTRDTCNATTGQCVFTPNDTLCDDGIDCTSDFCDVSIGRCVNIPIDSVCTATSDCRTGRCSLEAGHCVYTDHNTWCDDYVDCTHDYCGGVSGCQHNLTDSLCNDYVNCTHDVCTSTGCTFTPQNSSCEDGISCTLNYCDREMGCQFEINHGVCADAYNCTVDYCDVEGDCQNVPSDLLCSDGISCTVDVCNPGAPGGECSHNQNNTLCEDGFTCSVDTCDPALSTHASGCTSNHTACNWMNPGQENCIDCHSSRANIVERTHSDATSGASLEFRTRTAWGTMETHASFLSTDQVIFGGSLDDTPISANDGVIVHDGIRIVPVADAGECNEVRRGSIVVVSEPFDCAGRTCHRDVLKICVLGQTTYEWQDK